MTELPTKEPVDAADRLAIRTLIDRYAHCADGRDTAGHVALFTDDAVFAVYRGNAAESVQVLHGHDELAHLFEGLTAYQATTHFNGQSIVFVEGGRATGESYCIAHHVSVVDGRQTLMVAAVRYLDTFIKQHGRWLFAERKAVIDWTETRSADTARWS
jgi:ketosteroid isomerase-like protein